MSRKIIPALALIMLVLTGSAAAAETFTFKVFGIQCVACAPPIRDALSRIRGVSNVAVDWKTGQTTVQLAGGVDKSILKTTLSGMGYAAAFPGEDSGELKPLSDSELAKLDRKSYDGKQRYDLASVMASGKITIVDFYADWCGPCHVLDTRIQHYMLAHPDVAVRRIDMGKWDNPAAKQATREFRLAALPYVRIYDARGKFVKALTGGMWDEILAAIETARTSRR